MSLILPERIRDYLNTRGITDEVISKYNITWNGINIVIPVYNELGNFIFNKYRRDPGSEIGPKYKYDVGSILSIYNAQILKDKPETVFLTEGEFDALALVSLGYTAISSTGGAGSFDRLWTKSLSTVPNLYICYDNDPVGMQGALNVQSLLPHAKIIWIPEEPLSKDVTDYLLSHPTTEWKKLVAKAESYNIPEDTDKQPETKAQYDKVIKEYETLAQTYLIKQRALKYAQEDYKYTEVILAMLNKKADYYKTRRAQFDQYTEVQSTEVSNNIQKAKNAFPISNLIQFNRQGFARCPFHNDGSPSLKYYHAENYVYCYAGCGHKDLIDVLQAIEGVDFNTAVKKLTNQI